MRCIPLDPAEVEDHTAVETILGGDLDVALVRECWFWKDMDMGQVEEDAWGLCVPGFIISWDSLKDYMQYVMDFTTSLSRQHGQLQHLTPRSHSWWSPEIARAISSYCLAPWEQQRPDDLLSARCQQNSIICRAKAANFHDFIHQVAREPQAL